MVHIVGSGIGDYSNIAQVTDEGRLLVDISGATINIGSVSANVDSIYVQSGIIVTDGTSPIDALRNNPAFLFEYVISGTSTGVAGSRIGSITQFIGAGSFVNVLTYSGNRITNIGSWS